MMTNLNTRRFPFSSSSSTSNTTTGGKRRDGRGKQSIVFGWRSPKTILLLTASALVILVVVAETFVYAKSSLLCPEQPPQSPPVSHSKNQQQHQVVSLLSSSVQDDSSFRRQQEDSHLFPDWKRSLMLSSSSASSSNVQPSMIVSFQVFDLNQTFPTIVPAVPPFFYPVEDTLHSANYIMKHETEVLQRWMQDLRTAQLLFLSNHDDNDNTASAVAANCLDVGSNGGFFTLLSRSAGCRTLAIDAQPRCLQRLSSAAALNDFQTNLDVRWTAVGEDPSASIQVGATKCSGLWAVTESDWINDESESTVNVSMTPLLDIVHDWMSINNSNSRNLDHDTFQTNDRIDLFKIDVEGSELAVLHSALPLFAAQKIGSVYAEMAPGRAIKITSRDMILETIEGIYNSGYGIYYMKRRNHFSLQEAQAWFSDHGVASRNDPDMFVIQRKGQE